MLFLPGRYAADVNIGFFIMVAGLGLLPGDVTIDGHVHVEADWAKGMALVPEETKLEAGLGPINAPILAQVPNDPQLRERQLAEFEKIKAGF